VEHSTRQLRVKENELINSLFEENRGALETYAGLLIWWNSKINLVSRDVSRETVLLHVKHSLFVALSESFFFSNSLIDTGAGGGLPGIPLAICFPKKKFLINDIVAKKIFAVNDMINKLGLRERVEGTIGDVGSLDLDGVGTVVTKHAFKLDQLYGLIEEKPWGKLVFLKGYEEAINESKSLRGKVKINIIKLDSEFMPSFYNGKGLVEVERISHE